MLNSTTHTIDSAPAESQAILQAAEQSYGFVPNLLGKLANSPATLQAYFALGQIFEKTGFTAMERQIVLLTISVYHQCHYCIPAHTMSAKMAEVPEIVIEAIIHNHPIPDNKLQVLHDFVIEMLQTRGQPTIVLVKKFLSVGYSQNQVLELLIGIAMKIMSNYSNHIMQTEIDPEFD